MWLNLVCKKNCFVWEKMRFLQNYEIVLLMIAIIIQIKASSLTKHFWFNWDLQGFSRNITGWLYFIIFSIIFIHYLYTIL